MSSELGKPGKYPSLFAGSDLFSRTRCGRCGATELRRRYFGRHHGSGPGSEAEGAGLDQVYCPNYPAKMRYANGLLFTQLEMILILLLQKLSYYYPILPSS